MISIDPRRRDTWLFWITAVLVLGAGLGLRDPWPTDEPRFALVAKQMVESGDWLFPHRGSELYSDKPPMLMWLQAAFYTVSGNWRVAFLLPSLLAALGTLWCVQDLGRRLWTRKVGLYAAWALQFAFQFTWQSKKAQIDLASGWKAIGLHHQVGAQESYSLVLLGPDQHTIGLYTEGQQQTLFTTTAPIARASFCPMSGLVAVLTSARELLVFNVSERAMRLQLMCDLKQEPAHA